MILNLLKVFLQQNVWKEKEEENSISRKNIKFKANEQRIQSWIRQRWIILLIFWRLLFCFSSPFCWWQWISRRVFCGVDVNAVSFVVRRIIFFVRPKFLMTIVESIGKRVGKDVVNAENKAIVYLNRHSWDLLLS